MTVRPTEAVLIFGLVMAAAGGAIAQSAVQDPANLQALCLDTPGSETDVVIDSCSRWISSGALTSDDLVQAYHARGFAYELAENFNEAIADLTRRMELLPPDAALLRERAKLQLFDAAIADLSEAIRLAPDDPENYLARGRLFGSRAFTRDEGETWHWNVDGASVPKGVWDEAYVVAALNDYSDTIRAAPETGAAYRLAGEAYRQRAELFDAMGDREKAIPDYSKAMALGAGSRDRRALAYLRLGNFAQAKADLDVLLGLYPRSGLFQTLRGNAHAGLGEHALAIQDFDSALGFLDSYDAIERYETQPQSSDMAPSVQRTSRIDRIALLNSRARSYQALGQTAAAEADLEQVRLLTRP